MSVSLPYIIAFLLKVSSYYMIRKGNVTKIEIHIGGSEAKIQNILPVPILGRLSTKLEGS